MPEHLWVNIYHVTEIYGGHEEGGWTYQEGIPEWSQQALCYCKIEMVTDILGGHDSYCPDHHLLIEAKAWIAGFEPRYLDSFLAQGKIDSEEVEYRGEAIHGRKEIREEDSPAHAYPDEQPFYE